MCVLLRMQDKTSDQVMLRGPAENVETAKDILLDMAADNVCRASWHT